MIRGLLVALLPALVLAADAATTAARPVASPPVAPLTSGWGPVSSQPPAPMAADGAVPRPIAVRVPVIGVRSALVDLAVGGAGELVPPQRYDQAGWFAAGPAPGAHGPAMIAGHVDSRAGPGVFGRLHELKVGDEVIVARVDGSELRFVVRKTYSTPKTAFPTDLVYSPTPVSELRLVTCGGAFDQASRNYQDNVIVEAVLRDP
ncbi:Sortase family protein [Lentzea waywayandensis]|uniref:Sortase family protein n=1 Tax=Lentzea waywayandensis TaxID=84724 RepID=A0A1I6FE23_9PSEU|nr:sortase [Lentzea waywayandensis]SFR28113.1 Sortase family protein [Lentzea waywayandensis]